MNTKTNHQRYTVITGASQGYGKAIATRLAERKHNLIIVSLPGEGLEEFAVELRKNEILVEYYEVDLTNTDQLMVFTEWVNTHFQISMLINNAGIGGTDHILKTKAEYIEKMIKLNVTATSLITHQLLPNMLKQPCRAYILNVSSMAAFCQIPYKSVYPASKRFIHDFSICLNRELRNTNVFVSVVHPGSMMTNANVSKRIQKQGMMGKIGLLTPEQVAEKTLNKLFRGDRSIIPGWTNMLNRFLLMILPQRIIMPMVTVAFRKQTNNN